MCILFGSFVFSCSNRSTDVNDVFIERSLELGRGHIRLPRASETFKDVILKLLEVVIYHVL